MLLVTALLGCHKDKDAPADGPATPEPSPLLDVEETASWTLDGLHGEAYVLLAEGGIPYVYAEDREDLARVTGFVVARDRFFMIDMIRRLSQGRLAEVLGEPGLAADQESRGNGMTRVVDNIVRLVDADPEWAAVFDAYAAGVNAYVDEVVAHRLPAPSEYTQLGPVLGAPDPATLLAAWDRRDVAAVGATLTYELGFETGDVGRQASYDALDGLFTGAPLENLRQDGLLADIWDRHEPVWPVSSAPGFGTAGLRSAPRATGTPRPVRVPAAVLARLDARLDRLERRLGHDHEGGFGSNAWAVAGFASADGRSLLAGDGHLPLSVPSLFYQIGLDTQELGQGDTHQVGLALPGFPTLAVGTNGKVAWSQTQLFGDITDWYREELRLDAGGAPDATRFQGAWQPLVRVDESYVVADVPLLGSVGRTETWPRYETFDGRLVAEIEGRLASPDESLAPGETLVNVQGAWVVPGDLDGDGTITAVSFDYTAFDDGNLARASDGFGHATDVRSFREATRGLVAYSQNIVASDANGDILYTGYQATPCRGYLPREGDGRFAPGADPTMLLDGTQYGAFTVPVGADGLVDESQGADPYRCVVPFDVFPQSLTPASGYVLTANNDIGNLSTDGSIWNDDWYVGGPWLEGYRAKRIDELLAAEVGAGTADVAAMSRIQGDHTSVVADQLLPVLLASLAVAEQAPTGALADLWTANRARFEEARDRLEAWRDRGLHAAAGVETFYLPAPTADDLDDAVATMIWAAWSGEFVLRVFDDEGFPGVWHPTGDTGRTRTLTRMLAGRGAGNPEGMASWNPDTQESAYFDDRATSEIETSDQIAVLALAAALDALSGPPGDDPGTGGFGTDDMDAWLWGLRHLVKFESLLSEVVSEDDEFGFLIPLFSITTDVLPLAEDLPAGDPRRELPWFPRPGDHLNVDAGNPGFTRSEFMCGSGPVFRMVVALGPDGAEGVNVLPGGQSGLTDSPHYADQAELWLGNETWPMRTTVEQVIAGATGRETYRP